MMNQGGLCSLAVTRWEPFCWNRTWSMKQLKCTLLTWPPENPMGATRIVELLRAKTNECGRGKGEAITADYMLDLEN
jgi:hypothetical protein